MELPKKETLVYAILVSEKPIKGELFVSGKPVEDEVALYLMLAFPEQLVPISAHKAKLRDSPTCTYMTFEKWFNPQYKDMLMSYIKDVRKGVQDLPRKAELKFGEGGVLTSDLIEWLMSDLIEKICPEFATSTAFIRKWSVIDGPEVKEGFLGKRRPSKILAIGIYSV